LRERERETRWRERIKNFIEKMREWKHTHDILYMVEVMVGILYMVIYIQAHSNSGIKAYRS
jgi:hypothetical protein